MGRDPIHPGKFVADELAALNMTPTELATALHVPPNRIYQIIKGTRAMTADTALRQKNSLNFVFSPLSKIGKTHYIR